MEPPARRTFFHPWSGGAILAVDWACFGLEWPLGPAGIAVISVAAFAGTYLAVERVQRELHGDAPRVARAKALVGALAAAVPFPVAGTAVGALILLLSGAKPR